jgi:hypothetical protein
MPHREFDTNSGIGTSDTVSIKYPIPSFETAMQTLRPGCEFDMYNNKIINWKDPNGNDPPTFDEIEEELKKENDRYEYYSYERNRSSNFPSIETQLDILYHDIEEGKFGELAKTGKWFATIKSVKESNPKPEGPEPQI